MHHVATLLSHSCSRAARIVVALSLTAWVGCQSAFVIPQDAALDKLLRPVTTSPNSVTMEIFEARIPLDQDEQVESVWQQVDEQCLDADLRRRLLANGLRAGVIGGPLPDELSNMLGLQSAMPDEETERVVTVDSAVPRVTRRVVQVNKLEPRPIPASELRTEARVLFNDDGNTHGKPFLEVEGRYELRAEAIPGQRVAVHLVPELHHGQLRNRYSGSDQGKLLIIPSRERETFERLTMNAELDPGELLIVGCLPGAEASLGGLLHTVQAAGRTERKFILVRVLETPASEILANK
jgi:hypothetical protein